MTAPPAAQQAPLKQGPLTDFVAAAGLKWLVVARPSELAHSAALRDPLERLVPKARLDAFHRSTGLDLREVPEGLVAGFDYSTLYVAETPGENAVIEERFIARLLDAERSVPDPRVHRVQGTSGVVPQTLVRIDRRLVAVSVGDPVPARIVELFALSRLKRAQPALKGSALSTIPPGVEAAPFRFYAAGPFPDEWARGARGILGAALAIGAGVWPEGANLRLLLFVTGSFSGEDIQRLSVAWDDLAQSAMGGLLSLDAPAAPPEFTLTDRGCLALQVRIPIRPLVSGLRAAVAADVGEILGLPDGGPTPAGSTKPHGKDETEKK